MTTEIKKLILLQRAIEQFNKGRYRKFYKKRINAIIGSLVTGNPITVIDPDLEVVNA